jgi:SHS2 domain-containing protein
VSFELREHTADVAVEARADTVGDVFAAVADGLAAAMCEEVPPVGERFELAVTAESPEALLYDYLDQLIYERDVRNVLPVENRAAVEERERAGGAGEWHVDASARGVPLDAVIAREVKAVTYSEMDLSRTETGWHAYVVFDV